MTRTALALLAWTFVLPFALAAFLVGLVFLVIALGLVELCRLCGVHV